MGINITLELISLVGAFMILMAYIGQQFKWLEVKKPLYNLLNLVGSAILGYVALRPFQAGFLLMEIAWCLVSLYALIRIYRGIDS